MATIITREIGPNAKGSPLTNVEMDQNLLNLNDYKAETSVVATLAPLNSPIFTGNPTAPNPAYGDDDTSIATTSFVQANAVAKTTQTGAAKVPAGTTAQRDGTPADGYLRYNSDLKEFEGYKGASIGWSSVGGGQMFGTAPVKGIFYNAQVIAEDVTVTAGNNGLSAGPIEVANGFTVTVANGSVWSVV